MHSAAVKGGVAVATEGACRPDRDDRVNGALKVRRGCRAIMQAAGTVIERRVIGLGYLNRPAARLASALVRLVSCRHSDMGRPVTLGGETYRACLDCGARRSFDTKGWNTYGPYHFSHEGD